MEFEQFVDTLKMVASLPEPTCQVVFTHDVRERDWLRSELAHRLKLPHRREGSGFRVGEGRIRLVPLNQGDDHTMYALAGMQVSVMYLYDTRFPSQFQKDYAKTRIRCTSDTVYELGLAKEIILVKYLK